MVMGAAGAQRCSGRGERTGVPGSLTGRSTRKISETRRMPEVCGDGDRATRPRSGGWDRRRVEEWSRSNAHSTNGGYVGEGAVVAPRDLQLIRRPKTYSFCVSQQIPMPGRVKSHFAYGELSGRARLRLREREGEVDGQRHRLDLIEEGAIDLDIDTGEGRGGKKPVVVDTVASARPSGGRWERRWRPGRCRG